MLRWIKSIGKGKATSVRSQREVDAASKVVRESVQFVGMNDEIAKIAREENAREIDEYLKRSTAVG